MTDYNDGRWHGWNGGECPVHPETVVEVVCTADGFIEPKDADMFYWCPSTTIIAFRVVKEYKEPREFWIYEDDQGNLYASRNQIPASFKVMEVLA